MTDTRTNREKQYEDRIAELEAQVALMEKVVEAGRRAFRWAGHSGSAVDHNDCDRCCLVDALAALDRSRGEGR